MKQKKLLLAGSHAGSTAIAVIEEIKKRKLDYEIHWLGMEYKNLKNLDIIFHNLESGKIENKFTKNTLPNLLKIPVALIKGYKLIKEIKPDLTLSFGSAAGAISCFWSSFLSIPVIIHEQTATAGRANIISSYFAKKILISRESSAKYFNKYKTVLTGNPINTFFTKNIDYNRNPIIKSILITGGSRGSKWINDAIRPILPKLLEKYYVILQAGEAHQSQFTNHNSRLFVFGQTTPQNMAEAILKSDIVISRAGANTVSELIALKKPSILIPIPWSYNDEQNENAKYMESLGLARILPQKELTPQRLFAEIEILIEQYPEIIKKTQDLESSDLEASEKVVDLIENEIK